MKRSSPPLGFSLLEVILSLSLSVVLVAAIGAAVDRSWRLTSQGQVEIERQQIARAVLRIMERDLRSVMFVPPSEFAEKEDSSTTGSTTATGATTGGASSAGNSTNSAGAASAASTVIGGDQESLILASRGIRGTQSSLEIDGARPQRELAFALPVNAAIPSSRTSDLRTVMYLLAGPGQAPQGSGGLVRKEGDRYAIASAEEQGRISAGNFSATLLAPEIIGLQFRYFDGVTWHPSWDSVAFGRMPRAVEVLIRFAPPAVKQTARLNAGVNRSTETVRLVIYIPAADPAPEENEL
jgi:type II secretory pathway component PulJ